MQIPWATPRAWHTKLQGARLYNGMAFEEIVTVNYPDEGVLGVWSYRVPLHRVITNQRPHPSPKTQNANASYLAMLQLAKFVISCGFSISIENQKKNSLLWKCSFVKELLDWLPKHHICEFQHCMRVGERNKSTHWLSCNPRNIEVDMFATFHLLCEQQHQHASWAPYIDETGHQIFPQPVKRLTQSYCVLALHIFSRRKH